MQVASFPPENLSISIYFGSFLAPDQNLKKKGYCRRRACFKTNFGKPAVLHPGNSLLIRLGGEKKRLCGRKLISFGSCCYWGALAPMHF